MEKEKLEQRKKIILDLVGSQLYVPMKIKEMAILLDISKADREQLEYVLAELIKDGKLSLTKKNKYVKAEENTLTGVFESHNRGFGFVKIEGEEQDVFIPENAVGNAFPQDKVQIVITNEASADKRREGKILKVIERSISEVVGTYQKNKSFGFVIPDNTKISKDIFIPGEMSNGAVTGHKVVVRITDYGGENHKPEGKVVEILGHINDPGTDILSIVKAFGLSADFPRDVKQNLNQISDTVLEKDYAGRLDIREWQTVTIDGEDAKDLDDAITIKKENDRFVLGVHIADVTNYVTEGSPLDKEALKRGTSVYLVDRVIPMLPHQLSNGICSLNQGEDRLSLSCIMNIDGRGNVVSHQITETLINVDQRMTYTSVKKILEDHDAVEMEKYAAFVPMFQTMEELASVLRKKRHGRGSIDFDFPETKVILDEKGKPVDIKPYDRNTATKIIEEFMLLANETVAEEYFWQELPFVYRSHDKPDDEKMARLGTFINNFGYSIKMGQDEIHPKELQKLLEKISDTPEETLISRLTLRSMKQARYTTAENGHFGLAAKYYCHFTSPIRRYPDLQIHRIIKENLNGRLRDRRIAHYRAILDKVAEQSSITERRAEEAERETVKLKKVEYMESRVGQEFVGVVSGITNYGLYVELENTVEGMIHVTSLKDDYYYYSEETYEMIGENTKKTYKLGETVNIRVVKADRILRTIDFEIVEQS